MSKIVGRSGAVGIGKESTRGTAVAPTFWIPVDELVVEDRVKTVVNDNSYARIEGSTEEEVIQKFSDFSMGGIIRDDTVGLMLYSLFGGLSSATAGGESAVYDHTITVGQTAQHQALTVAYKDSNSDFRIPNAVFGNMNISCEALGWAKFSAEGMGVISASASNTVAHAVEKAFHGRHATFKKASAQSGLAGASAVTIRSFSLDINSNIVSEDVLGSQDIEDVLNQTFEISGNVTLTHDDSTYNTLQNAGTYQALRFQLEHPTNIGNSENARLIIDLHRVLIKNRQVNRDINGIMIESFDFMAHYNPTDSAMATLVLTNETATY